MTPRYNQYTSEEQLQGFQDGSEGRLKDQPHSAEYFLAWRHGRQIRLSGESLDFRAETNDRWFIKKYRMAS